MLGYAADGYAKVKGIGAVITAFGVGELSAINAIAGAEAEKAAVVHIVGTPLTTAQSSGVCMHHSLGDGNYRLFADMYEKITVAQANLLDADTAAEQIDATLRTCKIQSRPVYIQLPMDMVKAKVDGSRLRTEIDLSPVPVDEGFEDAEVETILDRIYAAQLPVLIVDGFVRAYNIKEEANELVQLLGFPTFTTPFGKSHVYEDVPNFHGIYAGVSASPELQSLVNNFDLVLRFGPLDSDVNTIGFTSTFSGPTISFHNESVQFHGGDADVDYHNLHVKSLLRKLIERIDISRLPKVAAHPVLPRPIQLASLSPMQPSTTIDHKDFWVRMSSMLRSSSDHVLSETGTPSLGCRELLLPRGTTMINSSIWLSIGYMFSAAQGVSVAKKELADGGRTILFEGDGSFQMTAQELGTIIRNKLDLTLFLINNDGYVIERYIHGMEAYYNDVASWRYLEAPSFFGANRFEEDPDYPVKTYSAANWGQLDAILSDPDFQTGKGLRMVEVFMKRDDAPESLKALVGAVHKKRIAQQPPEVVETIASAVISETLGS